MSRRTAIVVATFLMVTALSFAHPYLEHYSFTGSLIPIDKIERLKSPTLVNGWDEDGLRLVDGRQFQLPDFKRLPARSVALEEAIKRGVEIETDGRVYGLLRIRHWCGNDPVREHIAKVDLSLLLAFCREGIRSEPLADDELGEYARIGRFSECGWDVGSYFAFQHFCEHVMRKRRAAAALEGGAE
jgi:hypothetical protein